MIALELDDIWNVNAGGAIQQLTVREIFQGQYSMAIRDWDQCQLPSGDWVVTKDVFARHGKYCLLSDLGAGTFACVFKAWDLKAGAIVALKTVHPHISEATRSELVKVFVSELLCTATLGMSGRVVRVLDLDHVTPYLVIEYCDGGSLAERLTRAYSLREAVCWAHQIATALVDAHGLAPKHIVHHDLKPSNLLFSNGKLMVSDFGGAMMMWNSSAPQTVLPYGFTFAYAPPEIRQKRLRFPKAVDIWSLGVILWELVAGVRPFRHDASEGLPARLLVRPEIGAIPPALEALIRDCLQTEPGKRPDALNCMELLNSMKKGT